MQYQVILVRHGETNHNKRRIVQGHLDTPLNETGKLQAVTLGKDLCHVKFNFAFSSDLQRAQNTCEIILSENCKFFDDHDIQFDARLRERKFGCLEDQPSGTKVKRSTEPSHQAEFVPEGGESLGDIKDRAKSFFESLCEKMSCEFSSGKFENEDTIVLLVSHGGFIKALFSVWTENYCISSNGLKSNFHNSIVGNASHSGVKVNITLPQADDLKSMNKFTVDKVDFVYFNNKPM